MKKTIASLILLPSLALAKQPISQPTVWIGPNPDNAVDAFWRNTDIGNSCYGTKPIRHFSAHTWMNVQFAINAENMTTHESQHLVFHTPAGKDENKSSNSNFKGDSCFGHTISTQILRENDLYWLYWDLELTGQQISDTENHIILIRGKAPVNMDTGTLHALVYFTLNQNPVSVNIDGTPGHEFLKTMRKTRFDKEPINQTNKGRRQMPDENPFKPLTDMFVKENSHAKR